MAGRDGVSSIVAGRDRLSSAVREEALKQENWDGEYLRRIQIHPHSSYLYAQFHGDCGKHKNV